MSDLDADTGTEHDTSVSAETPEDESVNLEAVEEIGQQEEGAEPSGAEEAPAEPQEPEFAVIEYEGEQYEVPPALKDAFMRNRDYTQKTQETAAMRKELEARFEQARQQAEASEEFIQHKAYLSNVTNQIDQYQNVDWQAYQDQDPVAANKHWIRFQQLKEAKSEAEAGIEAFEQQRAEQQAQEVDARFQQADAWARHNIPNWSDDMGKELLGFAVQDLAIPVDAISRNAGPELFNLLHLAKVGKASLTRGAKPQSPSLKPLRKVAAKASPPAAKSEADMDMDEYVAHRRKQGL